MLKAKKRFRPKRFIMFCLFLVLVVNLLTGVIFKDLSQTPEDTKKSGELVANFIANEYERQLKINGDADLREIVKEAQKLNDAGNLVSLSNNGYYRSVVIVDRFDTIVGSVDFNKLDEQVLRGR